MTSAQYVLTGTGERAFVNAEFVEEVQKLYPVTTKRIPLGYHVYTSPQGLDEVIFTQHSPVDGIDGQVYEVNWPADHPSVWFEDILPFVPHVKLKTPTPKYAMRKRESSKSLDNWELLPLTKEARTATGLYGFPKRTENRTLASVRKVQRKAAAAVRKAARRDPKVIDFLQVHAKRGKSIAAKILLKSYKDSLPKVASEKPQLTEQQKRLLKAYVAKRQKKAALEKTGGFGMYGFPSKTASVGLGLCSSVRESAGTICSDLHSRNFERHASFTGFLKNHSKRCVVSKLMLSVYPDSSLRLRRASSKETVKQASEKTLPTSVEDWLSWEE